MYHAECYIVGFSFYNKHVLLKIIKIKPGPSEGERRRGLGKGREGKEKDGKGMEKKGREGEGRGEKGREGKGKQGRSGQGAGENEGKIQLHAYKFEKVCLTERIKLCP